LKVEYLKKSPTNERPLQKGLAMMGKGKINDFLDIDNKDQSQKSLKLDTKKLGKEEINKVRSDSRL